MFNLSEAPLSVRKAARLNHSVFYGRFKPVFDGDVVAIVYNRRLPAEGVRITKQQAAYASQFSWKELK